MNHFKPNYAPSMNKWPEWMWTNLLAGYISDALEEEFG